MDWQFAPERRQCTPITPKRLASSLELPVDLTATRTLCTGRGSSQVERLYLI